MKRRSILISCVALIMALAVFVGCDNGPVYPHIAQSATLEQTATLLEGQVIPADAFKLTVSYLDGTTETRNVLPTEVTDRNGTADNGEKVEYLVGYDGRGIAIKPSAQIVAYPVDHITAVLNDGVVIKENTHGLKKTDVTVTAYFYDDTDTLVEKPISSSNVTYVSVDNVDEELVATITVGALGVEYTFEATATALPVADVDDLVITNGEAVLPQLDYETLPTITDDLISITAVDADDVVIGKLSVADVEIELVDSATYQALNGYNFKSESKTEVGVIVTYGEVVAEGKLTLTPVTLKVQPVSGFALVEDEEIGTPAAEDFIVDMYTTDDKFVERLDSSDVTLTYIKGSDKLAATYTPATTDEIWVNAEYLGVNGSLGENVFLTINEAEKVDTMTITATAAVDYVKPARQYYDNIARDVVASVEDLASITVDINYVDETKADVNDKVINLADFGNAVTVAYSTSDDEFKPLADEDDLLAANAPLYLYVTYTADGLTASCFVDVSTETPATAYVSAIELEVEYDKVLNGNPMMDATISYVVTESNDKGVVATAESLSGYTVLVNGYVTTGFNNKVTDEAQTLRISKNVTLADGSTGVVSSDIVNIPAGTAYVDESTVTAATIALKEDAELTVMVDDILADVIDINDLEVVSAGKAVPGMTIVGLNIPDSQKAGDEASIAVPVRVSYINGEGKTVVVTKDLSVEPKDWNEVAEVVLLRNSAAIPESGLVGGEERYTINQFSIAEGSFIEHGSSAAAPKITQVINGSQTITEPTQEFILQGNLIFTISYEGHDGTATTTVTVNRAN